MEPRGRGRGRGRGRSASVKVVGRYEEEHERGSNSKEKNSSLDSDSVGTGLDKLNIVDNNPTGFDICPPKQSGTVVLKPSLLLKNREKRLSNNSSNVSLIRPGMVLLTGYLSLIDQEKIVKRCRELGVGCGGFYQPGYRQGTKLHLKMMCLGKNWDPETGRYEDRRSFDGADPPQIPAEFNDLVCKALHDVNTLLPHNGLPSIVPDICIVNFYSQTGRLGLHQDKDESPASLSRGLPVVSFSIGDSADFLYGDRADLDQAEKLKLQSGDVLIFGGPSRNLFHGVTAIHQNTAPNLLLQHTNLCPGRLNLTFRQY